MKALRNVLLIASFVGGGTFLFAQQAKTVTVHKNLTVDVALAADVSSKTAHVGDLVPITATTPFSVDGVVVVPAGATGKATVTQVESKRFGSKPGSLKLAVLFINTVQQGVTINLKGDKASDPGKGGKQIIPVYGMFAQGGDGTIKAGAAIVAMTVEDTTIAVPAPTSVAVESAK
jgi:hypothetical protein